MKIITIEGLKGSGKTTLVKKLSEDHKIEKLEKFSKGKSSLPNFLQEFREEHSGLFKDIDLSLGLVYYANFFNNLRASKQNIVILDRGLLSLPYFGYYGYLQSDENLSFSRYEQTIAKLYNLVLERYKVFEKDSFFFILECSIAKTKRRLVERRKLVHSELLFLKNLEVYFYLKERFETQAKEKLKSYFLNVRNENKDDLIQNVATIEKMLDIPQLN